MTPLTGCCLVHFNSFTTTLKAKEGVNQNLTAHFHHCLSGDQASRNSGDQVTARRASAKKSGNPHTSMCHRESQKQPPRTANTSNLTLRMPRLLNFLWDKVHILMDSVIKSILSDVAVNNLDHIWIITDLWTSLTSGPHTISLVPQTTPACSSGVTDQIAPHTHTGSSHNHLLTKGQIHPQNRISPQAHVKPTPPIG